MTNGQEIVLGEQVGVILSFVLLALGVAELTETANFLPVSAYVLVLWVIAILLWLNRVSPWSD